ncbi:Pyrroline-5-carboxylate reductase OS=Ureibacillus acetophenoni OX=614649 GN=proC PE=3 SV=1 [Ureibacillus acetophenoni]
MQKVMFLGAGSMAEALIQGWIEQEVVNANNIYISNRSNYERLDSLSLKYGVDILDKKRTIIRCGFNCISCKTKGREDSNGSYYPSLMKTLQY